MHSAVFTSICPPCNDYPCLFLGRIVLLIDTTDIHTIPKVECVHIHVNRQQKEDHLRTLNIHYAWSCVTVTCTMKIHAERAFFRRSICPGSPTSFRRPRRRSWHWEEQKIMFFILAKESAHVGIPGATPESVLTLDQWLLKCAGHHYIYIYTYMCVCIYVYWIYIHTYITLHYIT